MNIMSTRQLIGTLTHKLLLFAHSLKNMRICARWTELANRVDQSQDGLNTPRDETSTNVLLELGDLRTKIARLTEQHTTLEGDVSFLKGLSEQVERDGRSDL